MKYLKNWAPFLAILATSNIQAENSIVNFQTDSIIVSGRLSSGQGTRNISSDVISPSRMPITQKSGPIARQLVFGFNICEPNKKTFTGKTLDSTASTYVISKNRSDTEIIYSVSFPELPSDWLENQNKYQQAGGCGYSTEPKIISLEVKGTIPFANREPQYILTDTKDGFTLKVEVKPFKM